MDSMYRLDFLKRVFYSSFVQNEIRNYWFKGILKLKEKLLIYLKTVGILWDIWLFQKFQIPFEIVIYSFFQFWK